MLLIPTLGLKNKMPNAYTSYINWMTENVEHIRPFCSMIKESRGMFDEYEEVRPIFEEGIDQFLQLLN
jgi:hypothetical protein